MKSKWIGKNPKMLAVIFESGDELVAGLERLAVKNKLAGSSFTGLGAFQEVTVGFFNWEYKKYDKIIFREQVEALSLVGDIALDGKKPQLHAHVVIGRSDGSAHGGHLLHGIVRPTMEVILTESPKHLHRKFHPDLGLALIDLKP